MSDVTSIPLEDWFTCSLSQEWNWAIGTIYLSRVPAAEIPAWYTTQFIVNPWKSNMQVAIIDSIDTVNKTANVSSITVYKGNWDLYTQSTHGIWSKVVMWITYNQYASLVSAINSKIDGTTQPIPFYATTVARDAALWATPSTDWLFCWVTATQQIYYSAGGTWNPLSAWDSVVANASTTVAGKVEQATPAQNTAWSTTGETGAPLFSTPADTATQIQSWTWVYWADAWWDDTYVVALTPTLTTYTTGQSLYAKVTTANTGACSFNFWPWAKNVKTVDGNDPQNWVIRANMIVHLVYDWTNLILQNEDFATTTNKGIAEMATDAEALAGTDQTRYINSKQAKDNYETLVNVVTGTRDASWSENVAHWLSRTPKVVFAYWWSTNYTWQGFYWDWSQRWNRVSKGWRGYSSSYMIFTNWANDAQVTGIDWTNLSVTWTDNWEATDYTLVFIA